MMFEVGNVIFTFELLVAEIIFLFPGDKKSHFAVRYILAFLVSMFLSGFFPLPPELRMNNFYQLFRFITIFALTVAAMALCFKVKFSSLVSACVAGYAVQHIAYHASSLVSHTAIFTGAIAERFPRQALLDITVFSLVYLAILLMFGRYAKQSLQKRNDMSFNIASLIIVFICLGLSRFARFFGDFGSVSVSLYAITCCLLALVVQLVLYRNADLRYENATMHLLWQEDIKQYEMSKKSIDAFNIKYHDLKHKLADLRGRLPDEEIDALKKAAKVYTSRVKTGNEALDVLLTENSLRCSEEGITLTYMGNGADLGFMNVMDVYSLFGNAVDNAIDAVRKVADPEKKLINIVTERMGDMISVDITNYFAGELVIEDGMPVTSKPDKDFHGFGMKSMKLIAEKYGGSLTAETDGDLFSLGIFLMAAS